MQFALTAICICLPIDGQAARPTYTPIVSEAIAPISQTGKERRSSTASQETLGAAQAALRNASASLSFSWNIPVNLSVFRRERYLWIVFDHSQNVDIEQMTADTAGLADGIIQIPHNFATLVRIALKPDVHSYIRREGLLWIIDLFQGKKPAKIKELPIFTQYDGQKNTYLFIPTTSSGEIVHTIDPEVGDYLTIATLSDIDIGIKNPYHYPEFDLLPSEQGLAIVQNAPDIVVSRGNTGITLRALNRSLYISENLDQIKRRLHLAEETAGGSFNLQLDKALLNKTFNNALTQINQDISQADKEQKQSIRLHLVRYYLSQGLGSEALHELQQLAQADNSLNNQEQFHALRGVANFLMRRYQEAIEDFSFGHLPNEDEAVFWRTLTSAAQNFQKEDAAAIFSFMGLIKDYPQELKERIALIAADASIKASNDIAAQNFIDILRANENPVVSREPQIHYLLAKKYVTQGYSRNALLEYHKASLSNSARYSSLSRYEETVLAASIGSLPPAQAVDELEKLRFAWSEMPFTINLLTSLSELYVKNRDYYNALRTLSEALPLADEKIKKSLTNKMVKLFEDIYYNNQDDKVPAVKSLALYRDFEWLAPKSRYYNQIVQKLADRLVAVDLMPRAGQLLSTQLKENNLTPIERGTIATRLALIRLFESNAAGAIQVLDKTENLPLSEGLKAHRKIIRAKALTMMGLDDSALDLLENDTSKNAILMKSEILWNNGRWGEASDSIKYLIKAPEKGKPLSLEQISYILDWATALKKSGKETVLVRLRSKFAPFFKGTKYESTFNVLTSQFDKDLIDINTINQAINEVEAFGNFARIYADSVKNNSLSDTIK